MSFDDFHFVSNDEDLMMGYEDWMFPDDMDEGMNEPDMHEGVTLVHETEKAQLFEINGSKYWIPKRAVFDFDEGTGELYVEAWFTMSEAE